VAGFEEGALFALAGRQTTERAVGPLPWGAIREIFQVWLV
jgi:hypothetical protein